MADETTAAGQAPVEQADTQVVDAEKLGKDGKPFDQQREDNLIEKLRAELKEAKAKAKKADEYEAAEKQRKEAEMTEFEKLQTKLKENEEKLAKAERGEMQRKAADKWKLPAELASRITGTTLEEMETDAESLSKLLPKQNAPGLPPTNPGASGNKPTDKDWKDFLNGGPLPQ